jgi:hypothetical protein
VRAAALAAIGGLPVGYGTSALLLGTGSVAAAGFPTSVVAVLLGVVAVAGAAVGAIAARAALAQRPPAGRVRGPRPDAALVLGVSLLAAILPGMVQSVFVERVASGVGSVQGALDVATTRLPGAAWAGGYLTLAVLIALLTASSAAAMLEWRGATRDDAVPPTPAATLRRAAGVSARSPVGRTVGRVGRGLAVVDGWLVEQPGLALVVVGAVVGLFVFR